MQQKEKKKEQQAIQYNLFRWGPCLVKLKISEENRKLFLEEGKASYNSYEKRLAGVLKKEVEFRDYKKFEKFFSDVFKLYADALRKWTGSKDENLKNLMIWKPFGVTFKDQETLIHRTIMGALYLGSFFYKSLKN